MKNHKLVDKYLDLIASNKMTETEINSMRKALGGCSSLSRLEKMQILNAFWLQVDKKGGIKITEEHAAQGLAYLKGLAWTPTGKDRQTKNNPFGFREKSALLSFKEFRLVALSEVHNMMGDVLAYSPVWLVKGRKASFEYVQGGLGDGIEVIR